MKRSSDLKRTTPLRTKAPLVSRSPLPTMSVKRAAQRGARRRAEQALGRDGTMGVCARCDRYGPVNGHERIGRAQGGDPTNPDCLLCPDCNTWAEDRPADAAFLGWKISRKWPRCDWLRPNEAITQSGDTYLFREAS